jgi:hypothetical protein
VRFYDQSEASFYYHRVPASAGLPIPTFSNAQTPDVYSADYRLSALSSWTYGVKVAYRINDHVSADVGYKRYEMRGNDHLTSSSAYPKAHIFTFGLSIWF